MGAKYRFTFVKDVSWAEVEQALKWAEFNAKSIFGETRVHLESKQDLNEEKRTGEITGDTEVGQYIARNFDSLLKYSVGRGAFTSELKLPKEDPGHAGH